VILATIVAVVGVVTIFIDWIYLRRNNRRAFVLECLGLAAILLIAIRGEWFTQLAHRMGIGRGVDLLTYPALIWLFREAILGRVRYYRHRTEITQLVRHLAIGTLREQGGRADH
jgi:hypothetical protein